MDKFYEYTDLGRIDKGLSHIHTLCRKDIKKTIYLPFHRNKGIEICFVDKGMYRWKIEKEEYILKPGNTSFTMPWQLHGGIDEELKCGILNWCILTPQKFKSSGDLYLGEWSYLNKREQKEIGKLLVSSNTQVFTNVEEIGDLFKKINNELENRMLGYVKRINNILTDMILNISRSIGKTKENKDKEYFIEKLKKEVEMNYEKNWKIEDICNMGSMKKSALNYYFNKNTGYSPILYTHMLKIEKSKIMLIEGKKKITDIAMALGYSSSQHFLKMFKKFTGISPSQYRKRKEN